MNLLDCLKEQKIYGIIREDDPERAFEVARAYIEGGIKFIELNCPLDVTYKLSKFDNIILIQGGIITSTQANNAKLAGAKLISSPIFQQSLVRYSSCNGLHLIPSVTTPNEAYNVWRARISLIKIYPVNEMGGVEYIKDLIKPMPFLNILPCGFVKIDEIRDYLKVGSVAVGVGREFYKITDYTEMVKVIKNTMQEINI